MNPRLEQLAAEIIELTGAAPPSTMASDAPVLSAGARAPDADTELYLVGLIGGKDVGKSSLVNALVGRDISARTSHGPGTESVIAYCHRSRVEMLRELLDREAPGQYQVVEHKIDALSRQALLDLPDIDSHYAKHVELTRRMLRHMLFPIWLQDDEKYADASPRDLLVRVAEGNAPQNFLFCLNKMDRFQKAHGPEAVKELREDYARRLMQALSLESPPRVWTISAMQPEAFDLPELRRLLSRQKSPDMIQAARRLADQQQARSVIRWARSLDLPARSARLQRLGQHAQEALAAHLGAPLLDEALPRVLGDPAYQQGILDDCVGARMHRWPLVGIINGLFGWIVSLFPWRAVSMTPRAAVHAVLSELDLAARVQAAFARLQLSEPDVSALYRDHKPWERPVAEQLANDLQRRLADLLAQRRAWIVERLMRRDSPLWVIFRIVLTIGALLWFPLVQPILEAVLADAANRSLLSVGLLVVKILGVGFLLTNASFLLIWFFILWALVRWNTQRQIDRQLRRQRQRDPDSLQTDPSAAVVEWLDELTRPIHQRQARLDGALQQVKALEESLVDSR